MEMNASCTRSKNSLKEIVAESLNNTSIETFYKGQLHICNLLTFIDKLKEKSDKCLMHEQLQEDFLVQINLIK